MQKQGHFGQKFKILILNSTEVTHFSLPGNKSEFIFLLSLPFIRAMDLSKLEISLLLYEDYLRSKMNFFKDSVSSRKLMGHLGKNFYKKKKLDKKIFDDLFTKYNEFVFSKGLNFKQQFQITKQMETLLKNNSHWWNVYLGLLRKIDHLVKSNALYKNYTKIYPSPDLQLGWLGQRKRVAI